MKITNTQNFLAALLAVLASTLTTSLVAQEDTNTVATAKPAESPERPPYWPWTVGIGVGTDALIGGGVSWRFSDHLGARVGFGWTESSWDAVGIAGLKYDIKARLMAEPLTLDLYPWKKNSFHLSLGMQFNQNELSGSVSSAGT